MYEVLRLITFPNTILKPLSKTISASKLKLSEQKLLRLHFSKVRFDRHRLARRCNFKKDVVIYKTCCCNAFAHDRTN